jgi:hypothetical protein
MPRRQRFKPSRKPKPAVSPDQMPQVDEIGEVPAKHAGVTDAANDAPRDEQPPMSGASE